MLTFEGLSPDTFLYWLYDFGVTLNFEISEMLSFFNIQVLDGFTFGYLLIGGFYLYIQWTIAKWILDIIL